MDKYYTQTIGTPVLTTSGVALALVSEVVVEPETGKVVGFLLSPRGHHVVSPNDIVFWDQHIFIHDEDDVLEASDIIKVNEVLRKHIPIMRNKVITQNGRYLGKVFDFAINPKLFVLTKIVVAKNLFGFIPYDEKIIAHQNIVEIRKDAIIVKNVEGMITAKEKKATAKENLQIDIAPSAFRDIN